MLWKSTKTLELYIDGACIYQDTIGVKMSDTKVTNTYDENQIQVLH